MITLTRIASRADGIFYTVAIDGATIADALTHAYPVGDGFESKTPNGDYVGVRGQHALHNGVPFETFEITGFAGHQGILFHAGNWNKDSEGCFLLGELQQGDAWEVVNSRATFKLFMDMLDGLAEVPVVVQ